MNSVNDQYNGIGELMNLVCGYDEIRTPMDDDQILEKTPFFETMSPDAKHRLLGVMQQVSYPCGERFITQGDEGDSLYIVKRGSCIITLQKSDLIHTIAVLAPGDIVGEMALLTGEQRTASVSAQSDVDLLKLEKSHFEEVCSEFPEIRHFLTQMISTRFARATMTAERVIGKYTISEILGKGGWSIVYKGLHTRLNMPVAIKMLKHNMAMEEDFINEFQNEARIIAQFNHPNIVKVYDIEHVYRTVFIIMECLQGVSLEVFLKSLPRLPLTKSLDVLLQICSGLAYAHEQGIIHRDIKPGNVFLQKNGIAKLVDFGLACTRGTKGDRVVGTPRYLSPEQITGKPVDERSDIYSLGITAYKMITGQEPFGVLDLSTLFQMQLHSSVPDPSLVIEGCPWEMTDFILKATQKNPADRYQSISEIIQELKPLARTMGVEIASDSFKQLNLMSLFLFYRDEHREILKQLITDFGHEISKTGVVLREADIKDI